MKKSDLYKIIKQTIKEQRTNKQSLKQKVKDIQQKINIQTGELEPLGKVDNPNTFTPIDQAVNTKDVPTNPSGNSTNISNFTWNEVCPSLTDYGDIKIYSGNCDENGDGLFAEPEDEFICCSDSNNNAWEAGTGDNWGPFPILNNVEIGNPLNTNACFCPFPKTSNGDGTGDLINCWEGDGGGGAANAAAIMTFGNIDQYLINSTVGQGLLALGANAGTNSSGGQGPHIGNHCSGCYHPDATNDGERSDGSQGLTGAQNTLFGCPDGSGAFPEDASARENVSCCKFTVDCATADVTAYNDGVTLTSTITLSTNNPSSIAANGAGSVAMVWDDPSPFNSNILVGGGYTDGGNCTFNGCANDTSSGNLAVNFTTVVYAGANLSGATYIDPSSGCIDSVVGCMDNGTDINGLGQVYDPNGDGVRACNYNPSATVDDPTNPCEYTSCAGCMDADGSDAALSNALRPTDAFWVGKPSCTYDANYIISDPTACVYDTCVGCMDADGLNTNDYDPLVRPTDAFWSLKAACTYDANNTVSNPTACTYDTCVGCTNQVACNAGDLNTITVNDISTCEWDCYGCMTQGMNGNANGDIISIYASTFTFDNILSSPGIPSDPAISPCGFTGCLEENDGGTNDYANFVCEIHPGLCTLDVPGPTALPCVSACPTGVPNTFLGTFTDPNQECSIQEVLGCINPDDCGYDSQIFANGGDQTIGAGYCFGVPGTCEECGVDPVTGGTAVIPDEDCGCTNPLACDYDSTAAANNDGDICLSVPGPCEICDGVASPTNTSTPIPDPACNGCIDPLACNFGWYTVSGVLNLDPTSPIIAGTTGITSDGSCVFPDPAACQICITANAGSGGVNATQYNGISWTEADTSCDGCAEPTACNYDPGASPNLTLNPTAFSSCITPNDCEECDNGNAVQTGDCECKDITAVRCNRPDEIHNFSCVTIDGNQPLLDMDFKVTTKLVASAKKLPSTKGTKNSIKERYKKTNSKVKAIVEYVTPYSTLNEQIGPADQLAVQGPGQLAVNTKVLTVTAVNAHPLPTSMPTDFPDAVCTDQNYKCYCYVNNLNTSVPGWPGHYHGCKATTDPVGGNVYEEMSECQAICNGNNQVAPVGGYGDVEHTSDGVDDSHLYNSPPMYDGDGTCFIGDTLITMPDNTTRRIDELKVDEIVKSEKETSQILKIDIHEGEFDLYSINGSKYFVTEDHPFQTTEGWKAIIPDKTREKHQIEAFVLKVGDVLIKNNGETEEILSLEKSEEKITTTTYNLMLDNEHVYYANNYLVHNGGVKRIIPKNLREKYVNPNQAPFGAPSGPIGKGGGGWPPAGTGDPGTGTGSGGDWDCYQSLGAYGIEEFNFFMQGCTTGGMPQAAAGYPAGTQNFQLNNGTNTNGFSSKNTCESYCSANYTGFGNATEPVTLQEHIVPQDVLESRKLRESFKNQFMNSSKSDKEAKIRKTIRRIIRNKKK